MGRYAWVTLATNDAYSLGALVLAYSLRRVGTNHELACMVTPGVTETMREKLAAVFSLVQEVNVLDSKDEVKLALLARPELGVTFTKLHCWRLTQYEKCVFLDADTLVVRNCDELFEREELSAAPDVGWPDCFNSGVFVFRPSQETFASITAFAAIKGSFDGGDQGLLNMYFSDWATKDISKHLPFIYNMCSTATYSYLPAFKQFGEDVRIIHFIGITKPWLQYFDTLTGIVQPPPGSTHLQPLLQLWWNIFCDQVHPQLSSSMASSTLAPIWHAFTPPSYIPSIPNISDARNRNTHRETYSRAPDFSEFKDPWEEYSPRNDSFPIDNSALSDSSKNCYCGYEKETDIVHQIEHNISQHEHNQQFHYEPQHSSYVPVQTYVQQQYSASNEYNQHREHVTSHSGENHNQGHSVQHTEHHHWQQYREQERHHVEQHQHNEHNNYKEQWNEQRHHHEQHQHHERRHHDEQHHSGQHSEHHHDSRQSHDGNKTDNYNQHQSIHQESHSNEVRHENHTQHYTNDKSQASHQNADYQNRTYNDSHTQHITPSNQHAQDNFSSHCHRCNDKSSEQSLKANTQTDTRRIDFLPPSPAPCIDLHNVAMRSDPNVTEHLDNANTGIAGALAQITLGTARSAEQTALEEHMRKQSWEQGQIDYMGRDSFDNIWKKICETLSFVPQRQPTPPKEDTTKSTESTATAEPAVETAAPMSVEVDKPVVEADKDPTQSLVSKDSPEQLLAAQTTCKIGDGSVIIAQFPEQKAPVLPSEKSVEAAATKISSEPAATGDICAKPTIEPKDVKVCETCTEVPSPKPPVESLPAETIAEQCKLASPQTTQDVAPQSESLPSKTKEPQQIVSQASTCLLTDVVCKPPAQEAITPVTQTDSTLAPTETKSGIPTSAIQDITQLAATPISVDSPQNVAASPVASEAPLKDTAKSVIEFTPAVTQPLTIDPSERHAEMLLAASEISTVSPVPIQVAESVLQAEPKESVSGAAAAVSDQAIATTVTAVQESTDVVPVAATVKSDQLNGSACESEKRGDTAIVVAAVPGLLEKTDVLPEAAKKPPSESLATKDAPSEAPSVIERKIESSSTVIPLESPSAKVEKPAEPAEQAARIEAAIVKPSEQITKMETAVAKPAEQITKTETAEAKPTEQIVKTETVEAKPTEQIAKMETAETKPPEKIAKTETIEGMSAEQTKVEITAAKQLETTETIAKAETIEAKPAEKADIAEAAVTAESPSAVPELPIVEQSPPVEPIETKASNIPTTPTVTEATPPTSPSVESAQEEAAKKSLKKSDSADGADGEGADKKGTKKTVKKVVKKPKTKAEEATPSAEGAATAVAAATTADNSQSKTKKTVKVTKKIGAKTGQSLETDTSVPETPPPPSPSSTATSETPVPPKRKTKSTTVSTKGTTGKKSETEE